jgi:glycosyltransferase involved in cell wall biosynthesis
MSNDITVTVQMTNFNHSKYIGEALDSVISQTYLPLEIIVIDDASTDNSVEIIQQFQRRCPLIKLFRNGENRGVEKNVETLVQLAAGDFIAPISADDKWLPGLLNASVAVLKKNPDAGLCCSDPIYFDDTGNARAIRLAWLNQPGFLTPDAFADAIKGGFIYGHTSVVNKAKLIQCGGFDLKLKWHCDWFAYLALAFRFGLCYVPEPFSAMREHISTYSSSGRNDWQQQKRVIADAITLMKSPLHHDLLHLFTRGNVMAHFGDEAVMAVIEYPELWDAETMTLIEKQLINYPYQLEQIPGPAYGHPILAHSTRPAADSPSARRSGRFEEFLSLKQGYLEKIVSADGVR